ncbi:MAG: NAD-dependent epimerase/dehydratase family protein [Acidobacteriaceae bacterium]
MREALHKKLSIEDVAELEDILSEPTEATVRDMAALEGDIVILGVGGKMGPTLARMARKASDRAGVSRRVIGVARFSVPGLQERLESWGIETHAADLLDRNTYADLPDAANVVYMAGMKFGATGQESLTWAMNTFLPAPVCERYSSSRMAVFSTGNIYGLCPVGNVGSLEEDEPRPVGEYAMSCLGRERIFDYFSRKYQIKMSILRIYYATELRYGVMVDLAQMVLAEQPVPLAMGHFNAIWQADASAMSLQSLVHASTPPLALNIAGPELLSVRQVALQFGERFNKKVHFEGVESGDGLLCNSQKAAQIFGYPQVSVRDMMTWIADWVERGKDNLGKPTHFENRKGNF